MAIKYKQLYGTIASKRPPDKIMTRQADFETRLHSNTRMAVTALKQTHHRRSAKLLLRRGLRK